MLNVNKPPGITSFGVISRVRAVTGIRRAGHAGTLDPLATGVLLVCLGQATRVVSYLQDAAKVYLADIRLGQRTDTYDALGSVVEELPVPESLTLERYLGDIWQSPPAYSALKRAGKPLYAYARAGQTVEIAARLVHVDRIDLVAWEPPYASLRIACGKGTYIRSLANDLGGHLVRLVREAIGAFRIEDSLDVEELGSWENYLMPIEAALPGLATVAVNEEQARRIAHGLPIAGPPGELLALSGGRALAILRDGRPKIVFGAV